MPSFAWPAGGSQTRIFLTAGIILLAVLGLSFLLLIPEFGRLREVQSEILEGERRLLELGSQTVAFKRAAVKSEGASEAIAQVLGIFPVREESVGFVEALEEAMGSAGVEAALSIIDKQDEGVVFVPPEGKFVMEGLRNLEAIPYTLQFSTDYESLVDLFLYLENMPFLTEIQTLKLNADSEEAGPGVIENTGTATGQLWGVFFITKS